MALQPGGCPLPEPREGRVPEAQRKEQEEALLAQHSLGMEMR